MGMAMTGPLTPAEQDRLGHLYCTLADFERKTCQRLFTPGGRTDQAWRNVMNHRSARGAPRVLTVTEEAMPEAQAWIDDLLAGDTEEGAKWLALYSERDELAARAKAESERVFDSWAPADASPITARALWQAMGADPDYEPQKAPDGPASGKQLWRANTQGLLQVRETTTEGTAA
jgi:hypothetical protein